MKNPVYSKTKPLEITLMETCKKYDMQRQHYHETYEVYLQLDGERNLFFDNEKYLLQKGSLFVINPFVLHVTSSAQSLYFKRYLLNFSRLSLSLIMTPSEIDKLLKALHSCVITLNDEQLQEAHLYFNQISKYMRSEAANAEKLMQMSLALLIDFICSAVKTHSAITLLERTENTQSPIYTAIAYINSNYEKEITLDFISNYVHMSKSNFCLVFKKITGTTFVDYLNMIRITQVHKILSSTNMPLREIAVKTGFSSVDYMSRIFKSFHGTSASLFRKNNLHIS